MRIKINRNYMRFLNVQVELLLMYTITQREHIEV